jgi:hypothetical protein
MAREAIGRIRADEARLLAGHVLTLATAEEIEKYLFEALATSAASRNR